MFYTGNAHFGALNVANAHFGAPNSDNDHVGAPITGNALLLAANGPQRRPMPTMGRGGLPKATITKTGPNDSSKPLVIFFFFPFVFY